MYPRAGLKLGRPARSKNLISVLQILFASILRIDWRVYRLLLQHGARTVVSLDVATVNSHGVFGWTAGLKFREGINARFLMPSDFSHLFDIITVEYLLSRSQKSPKLQPLLTPSGHM